MRQGGLRRHVPAVGVVRRAGIDGNKSRFGGERVVVRQLVILLTCSSARVQLKPVLEWGILNRRRFIDEESSYGKDDSRALCDGRRDRYRHREAGWVLSPIRHRGQCRMAARRQKQHEATEQVQGMHSLT